MKTEGKAAASEDARPAVTRDGGMDGESGSGDGVGNMSPQPDRPSSGDSVAKQPKRSLFDPQILGPALREAFRKLDPRHVARNPVMLIVEIGALATTTILLADLVGIADSADVAIEAGGRWFVAWIAAWLWFTILFANVAEAMAEVVAKRRGARA